MIARTHVVSIKWMVIINMNLSLIIMTMSDTEQHRVQSSRALPEISLQSSVARTPGHLCAAEWSGQGLCQVAAILSCTSSALHLPSTPHTVNSAVTHNHNTAHAVTTSLTASRAPAWPLSKLEYKCLHCCRIFPVALTSGYRR